MHDEMRNIYSARQPLLEQLARSLEEETREALKDLRHVDRVSFRAKSLESFLTKAANPKNQEFYTDTLSGIEDQVAGRVIVFFLSDRAAVRERLEGRTFNPVEEWTRAPERDAEFGYESDHIIFNIPELNKPNGWNQEERMPTTFELQIRTIFMHAYAEPQHDVGYKGAADLPRNIRRELGWIAASAWGADQAFDRVRAWDEMRIHPENGS